MGAPDQGSPLTPAALDRIIDDQALVVLAALDELRHDLAGAVHDARVALRKLRSTLVVFRPLLDAPRSDALAEDLRWFAGELSEARDAQVVRARVASAVRASEADESQGEELLAELDRAAAVSWDRAEAALVAPRLQTMVTALENARLRGLARRTASEATLLERTSDKLDDLIERARATIAERADDERIHALRKRVKRVRFAVASLRDTAVTAVPGGTGVGRVAHALEDLQDQLGEYQDAVVTAALLDQIGRESPRVADLAAGIAARQRTSAAFAREALPDGVARVRRAAGRLRRRRAQPPETGAPDRTPHVHL